MDDTPGTVVIDLVLNVKCGQSVVVPINGQQVLISAGADTGATPPRPPDPGGPAAPKTPAGTPLAVPVALPIVLPPVKFTGSSVANIIKEIGDSVPVLELGHFLRCSEATESGSAAPEGQLFEIEGVAVVALPHRTVASGDYQALGVDVIDEGL